LADLTHDVKKFLPESLRSLKLLAYLVQLLGRSSKQQHRVARLQYSIPVRHDHVLVPDDRYQYAFFGKVEVS